MVYEDNKNGICSNEQCLSLIHGVRMEIRYVMVIYGQLFGLTNHDIWDKLKKE